MNGKTVIITGGNGSLGKATAKELAQKGARVILACRNLETGNEARGELIQTTGNRNILLKKINLASQSSIRKFAAEINKTEARLDILIHNAAVVTNKNLLSEDGLELTMATNHFGPFLLTHLLIDLLKKSAPSRIIVISSIGHHLSWVDASTLNNTNAMFPSLNYLNSKFVNICFTRELARRLEGTKVTANCLNPGFIATELWQPLKAVLFPSLFNLFAKLFLLSPTDGCKRAVYLAVSDEVANVSGKYFHNDKVTWTARGASSNRNCREIWKETQKILKFKENECII